ncbi:MAG: glutamate-cysteine ligase family protein, partial [Myxococcota bacterium]|nr:glutamate-cysteine ligase family protein [Myxococcota bacterium]
MNELSPEQSVHVRSLAERFGASFPDEAPTWRTVGREAEYPVVWPDGSAADVTDLWDDLAGSDLTPLQESEQLVVGLEGEHYSYALEVGWGTIEVITGPCEDLHGLSRVHEDAVQRLVRVAEAHGRHVLGYGIQPRTPASVELMSPKHRYGVLLEAMGEGWLWFTQTASDQVHVDVGRQEVVAAANLGNLLAPVTIALTGNSPVHEDQSGRACSLREEGMGTIEAVDHRHGMPDTPWRDLEDMVGRLARQRLFMDRIGGQLVATDGCFLDHLERLGGGASQAAWESFLLHEHYAWNSARPRSAQGTVELRAACQQPWSGHMSAAALGLAL